ncbi:hypothetical protein [Terrisporobacter muris]|uniref:Uncharacterized protein n=1 Tax=Terrisporobacter muris TaxID=2963284 RepID=A0A9X2M714_9FIRM|nr:hypothetical protein [Terrisporobacter muris]MCR1822112.1 hypothetical protein [Terrisporobacter muris]
MIKIGSNNFLTIEEIAEGFNVDVDKVYELFTKYDVKSIQFNGNMYVLENEFLKIFTEEPSIYKVNDNNKKYPVTEKQILTEAISLLQHTGQLSIKELRERLKETMDLSEEDLQINKNRNDTKFDQKVRNLISHRDSNGLIEYCDYEKIGKEGFLKLKRGSSK